MTKAARDVQIETERLLRRADQAMDELTEVVNGLTLFLTQAKSDDDKEGVGDA